MRAETWSIISNNGLDSFETQLALQSAPLIANLKISNLIAIKQNELKALEAILSESEISYFILLNGRDKLTILLFHRASLIAYLNKSDIKSFFIYSGYSTLSLDQILIEFRERYKGYMDKGGAFPHEMGLLLGYPLLDVVGFIENNGANSLCSGYWKVYANKEEKLALFELFERAKERIISLLASGVKLAEIFTICCTNMNINYVTTW